MQNKEKDLIIMLHGFTSNPNQFRKLKKYFENNNYEVLTPTLNNHKDGEENQNFDLKEMIEEMENLCEKMNQEGRKITMIGESMGAIITLKLATKIKLEKIIVLSTPIKGVKKELIIERINTKNKFLKTINKKEEEIKKEKVDNVEKKINKEIEKIRNQLSNITSECVILYGGKDEKGYKESAEYILEKVNSKKKEIKVFKETSHTMILGKEKEEVEEYIKRKIGGNDLKVYKKEIEELKSEIKNKKELEKIEEKFTKDKDEYLFLINLLNYISNQNKSKKS